MSDLVRLLLGRIGLFLHSNMCRASDTQGLLGLGTSGKQGNVVLRFQCHRSAIHPYPRREDTEGGLGKIEKDFCGEYHGPEVAAQTRAQQYLLPTTPRK